MSRALPLAAYLALRRGPVAPTPAYPTRPKGPLVWVHCPDPARIPVVTALAAQLAQEGDWPTFLVTSIAIPDGVLGGQRFILQPAPPEQRDPVRAFLDHWRPDVLLWMQGDFLPALLAETDRIPLARLMIDMRAARVGVAGGGWMPGLTGAMLDLFDHALVIDHDAAIRLRKAGFPAEQIEVTGPLDPSAVVLPCNERERRDLAQTLGSRSVWCAAEVPMVELEQVSAAHRQASRRAHRLLLILVPAQAADAPEMAQRLRDDGFVVTCRSEGAELDEATQIYLADGSAEMGLWYRLAPFSFMGGTLEGTGGRHPYEPAGLGSAVLHGPVTAGHAPFYQRLASAGASRAVRSAADLGNAVEVLLAPDKAAAMAHAAWDVTSSGAEVTNRVVDLIRNRLDKLAG